MNFVLRMAWRELRASWTRLLFFFACVAVGVGAIVALRSIVQDVRAALTGNARALLAADVVVQSAHDLSAATEARLDGLVAGAPVRARTEVIQTTTMARAATGPGVKMVEVRAVEAAYPLYGALTLQSGRPYSHALLAHHGVIVQPELLSELGVGVGGTLLIDNQPFQVRDVLVKDSVQRTGFAFGPRVYLDLADLRATSLLGYGSRASRQWLFAVDPPGVDALTARLRAAFDRDTLEVQSSHTLDDRLGRALTVGENDLSLIGFAIVVLGGIGVWSVTRVFILQKVRTIAILKCVGARTRQVMATYVLQVLALAAAGSVLGVALAAGGLALVPRSLLDAVEVASARVTPSAALQGVAVGLLVSLLFAVVPLLEIRRIKPLRLLRADSAPSARRADWRSRAVAVALAAALALVAIWQAGSVRAGLYVVVGLGGVALALDLASRLLLRLVAPLARSPRFAVRHAALGLGRPGNQTRVVLTAVGLGAFFMLGMRAVQTNLLAEFSPDAGGTPPDLILIDIQPDQVDGVRALVAGQAGAVTSVLPLLRARLVGVDGDRVHLSGAAAVREHGDLGREFGITWRDGLDTNERLVAGRFWQGPLPPQGTPDGLDTDVSIEESLHASHDIDLGDVLSFDLAGRVVRARVTSIRKVAWDDARNGGFMFVFQPGPIERAPHTFVGFVSGLESPASRAAVERAVADRYANVSAIDVRDVLAQVASVLKSVTLAVSAVGAILLTSGLLVLMGAVAMTRFQRLYEAAIYRTLGAGTRALLTLVGIEYGLLGLLAGGLGAAGALAFSWAVCTRLFEIDWQPTLALLAGGVAAVAIVVAGVGLAASADVLLRPPLGTLRRE